MPEERLCNWTEMPLHTVLNEWLTKNLYIPSDWGTLVAYIGLFLIAWYTVVLTIRLVVSIVWPLILIVTAIIVLRIMQYYEPEEVSALLMQFLSVFSKRMAGAMTAALEWILGYFN